MGLFEHRFNGSLGETDTFGNDFDAIDKALAGYRERLHREANLEDAKRSLAHAAHLREKAQNEQEAQQASALGSAALIDTYIHASEE